MTKLASKHSTFTRHSQCFVLTIIAAKCVWATSTCFAKKTTAIACLMFNLLFTIALLGTLSAQSAHAEGIFSWFTSNQTDTNKSAEQALFEQHSGALLPTDYTMLHNAAFGEVVYHYFQGEYQQVLLLIAVGNAKHQFSFLSEANSDRLDLMQGAAQLNVGLFQQSQAKFSSLLSKTSSEYVQANTWYFMAKAGFENKQANVSEQAYEAIVQGNLRQYLSESQWFELLYLSAHTRMQLNQDWQTLQQQIPSNSIYTAYLFANRATILFNQGDYESANTNFVNAKQALIALQNKRSNISQVAEDVYDSVSWFIKPWRWYDSNANAEAAAKERQEDLTIQEQNALFDSINMGLGQSLLQQRDLGNAVAVLQTVANGAEFEQALLTFGWANAYENRWQTAMSAWQYLQQNSAGIIALQASYGLAHAYGQQDKLGQAFYALQDTSKLIDANLAALDAFASKVESLEQSEDGDFFTHYKEQWPAGLEDLKLSFFKPKQDFDASYLLMVREQALAIIDDVKQKEMRVLQLNTLLQERNTTYNKRLQNIRLHEIEVELVDAQQMVDNITTQIAVAQTFEQQLALSKRMASSETSEHLLRLQNAQNRHARLANDSSRKRPLRASYQTRLKRIEGILQWQLMDNFIAIKWQHQQLLAQAQKALSQAKEQFKSLQLVTQQYKAFSLQKDKVNSLQNALVAQTTNAEFVYSNATKKLVKELLALIALRKKQLQEQGVNTRLAMLRIQDLQQSSGE